MAFKERSEDSVPDQPHRRDVQRRSRVDIDLDDLLLFGSMSWYFETGPLEPQPITQITSAKESVSLAKVSRKPIVPGKRVRFRTALFPW
jgi:hypothetical protein